MKTHDEKSEEELVYITGQRWCGSGGCTMLILEPVGSSFKVLGKITVVQLPIRLLPSTSYGRPISKCVFSQDMRQYSPSTERAIPGIQRYHPHGRLRQAQVKKSSGLVTLASPCLNECAWPAIRSSPKEWDANASAGAGLTTGLHFLGKAGTVATVVATAGDIMAHGTCAMASIQPSLMRLCKAFPKTRASTNMGNGHGPIWVPTIVGIPAAVMAWYLLIRTPKSRKQILVGVAMAGTWQRIIGFSSDDLELTVLRTGLGGDTSPLGRLLQSNRRLLWQPHFLGIFELMRGGFDRLADLAGAFDDAGDEVDPVLREVVSLLFKQTRDPVRMGLATPDGQDIGRSARSGAWVTSLFRYS